MAPPKGLREPHAPAEEDSESKAFFQSLRDFHSRRGTVLDVHSRVNGKHIDLFKLYNAVVKQGGYDKVSSEKLAWRQIGAQFNVGTTNAAAYAFALKTVYYKNLSAYELKTQHNQEPPPKEILENVTAKGGDLRNRTLENFKTPQRRETLTNGQESDSTGEEEIRTPKEERMDIDDPGSGAGRTTRGLRQAPPQRVLFQPDVSSSRQARHSSGHLRSPQPAHTSTTSGYAYSSSSNSANMPFGISSYEPTPLVPMKVTPLATPGNDPEQFQKDQAEFKKNQAREAGTIMPVKTPPKNAGMMKPGAGFDGPNIYIRTLLGLRCGIPAEVDYALHHLVKISHERGDKYKFEAFPGLAEGLMEKVLEVGNLFYDIKWEICYTEDDTKIHLLEGLFGTKDILERIMHLKRRDTSDELETPEFVHDLNKICEAGLVIRNMILLEDNAEYLADMAPIRDLICIVLNLPPDPRVNELQHYALEIAEEVTKYWSLDERDPVYISLLMQLESQDRGRILTALRALSRISMSLEDSNLLKGVPISSITRLCQFTLLDDEELIHASLDFLYQYTAVPENVALLLTHFSTIPLPAFLAELVRLLLYQAQQSVTKQLVSPAIPAVAATDIPDVPFDLLDQILKHDEPERSIHWLRACFEEDPESDITQIRLWQAYQARFTEFSTPLKPLLPAAEFIKNVSTTFTGANAQVVNGPVAKYTIKGIRPRHIPMDMKGRSFSRCLWKPLGAAKACGEFILKPQAMWEHVVTSHIGIPQDEEGRFNFAAASSSQQQPQDCCWAGCLHFARVGGVPSPYDVGMHMKTHLPDTSRKALLRQKQNRSAPTLTFPTGRKRKHDDDTVDTDVDVGGTEATYSYQIWRNTAVDERGDAAGLPLTSVLILRNLARNVPKASALLEGVARAKGEETWMEQLFGIHMKKLGFVMAHNRPLAGYVSNLFYCIEEGVFT